MVDRFNKDGAYVRYSDYVELESENASLRTKVEKLRAARQEWLRDGDNRILTDAVAAFLDSVSPAPESIQQDRK